MKPTFFSLLFVVEYVIERCCYQNRNWDGVCECKLIWKSMVYSSTLFFLFTLDYIFVYRDSKCIYLSLDWQNKSQTFRISKPFHFWIHFFGPLMKSGTVKSNKPFTFTSRDKSFHSEMALSWIKTLDTHFIHRTLASNKLF